MYHPGKYSSHNESLKRFIEAFNRASERLGGRFVMEMRREENFRDDGVIRDRRTGKEVIFDWEKRHSYYERCGFPFKTFGQFERKIQKEEIELSIQCSKDERCFCIAWHEDFKKEEVRRVPTKKEDGTSENTGKRYTKKFLELRYTEMDKFYRILERAFDTGNFNSTSWEEYGNP